MSIRRRYVVDITANAMDDLLEIHAYIARDNPLNADRFLDRLEAAARSLDHAPHRAPPALERSIDARPLRQVVVGNYRIIFSIDGHAVRVLRFTHAGRHPRSL